MAMWRPERRVLGPERAAAADIEALNRLFADAFTERYARDGLTGVRVPHLAAPVWRYAIEAAGDGALLWRDEDGELAAFNMAHRCGIEGWMGPIAVRTDRQGRGVGTLVVRAGIDWLLGGGARVVGLETMPRTIDNIGFYGRLGFVPRHLTVTLVRDAQRGVVPRERLSRGGEGVAAAFAGLVAALRPGADYATEVRLTRELELGDLTLVERDGVPVAAALWHGAPLAIGRGREELRVLKLAARDLDALNRLLAALEADASEEKLRRLSLRAESGQADAYRLLVRRGYRAHWTDLRMTLPDAAETAPPGEGVVFSNWEI